MVGFAYFSRYASGPRLDGLKEGNDNATKILVKCKRSGSAGLTTEHSLDGGFGVVVFCTIDKARGSERIDGNVTARDLSVKVNDCGSNGLANIGSNANKGKIGSGLDNVDVGGHERIQGWKVKRGRLESAGGAATSPPHTIHLAGGSWSGK